MVGFAAAAAAAPGAESGDWTLSALEVPGSMTWTLASVGAVGSGVGERTSNFVAPVTTYGLVPEAVVIAAAALAASAGSGPSPWSGSSVCHWLQVAPVKVRIWNWSPAVTAFFGHVTPTTARSPGTSCTGVTAPDRELVIGSGAPGALWAERVAPLATRIEATEVMTKPTSWLWLLTGCGVACEEICGNPVTIGATARTLAKASTRHTFSLCFAMTPLRL